MALLRYPREHVRQDTFFNCGPASCQTVIAAATGRVVPESELARKLGTTTNGTNYIGRFPAVLNSYVPGADYAHQDTPRYMNAGEKNLFWERIVNAINGGWGVVANIVAPPSNYPRAVEPSTINFRYGGGVVYHYVAVMGCEEDHNGRRVWIADSGFYPHGGWISFEQLCSLIVPKGYAYPTTQAPQPAPTPEPTRGENMIESLINPAVKFPNHDALLAVVDAGVWTANVKLDWLVEKAGGDPAAIVQQAINADRARKGQQ